MSKEVACASLPAGVSPGTLLALYASMLRLRMVEEKVAECLKVPLEIVCPVHLYTGQEAVAAGVCANLRRDDYVYSTHRSHGHFIAKGGSLHSLIAELYGRETGCSHGRGGSMHLAAPEMGLPGSSAIVAGTIPLAVGSALAFKIQKTDRVSAAFFGDGATNEGAFYESLNLAALRRLPVIFVCENNLYSTHMPIAACLSATDIYRKAEAFAMPGRRVDGNDVVAVYAAAQEAVERARQGDGPTLIECLTYRWRGHVGPKFDLDKGLRPQAEFDEWMEKCPLKRAERLLAEIGACDIAVLKRLRDDVDAEIDEAIASAKRHACPAGSSLLRYVYAGEASG